MIKIIDAILSLDPTAEVIVHGDDIDNIIWADGNPRGITHKKIREAQDELQTLWNNDYSRKREGEYPNVGDQLDALLKHFQYRQSEGDPLVEELDEVISAWLAVKVKYPKQPKPPHINP